MPWRTPTSHEQTTLAENASLLGFALPQPLPALHLLEANRQVVCVASQPFETNADAMHTWVGQHRQALHAHAQNDKRLLIISGMANPALLSIANELLNAFPKLAIAMLDPKTDSALGALSQTRLAPEQGNRLMVVFGDDAEAHLVERLEQTAWFLNQPDDIAYVMGASPLATDAQAYVEAAKRIATSLAEMRNRVSEQVHTFIEAQRTVAEIASVWSCTSRQSYIHFPLVEAFLRGFESHGVRTRNFPYQRGYGEVFRAVRDYVQHNPEVLFLINTLPTAFLLDMGFQAEAIAEMNTPRVSWLVDDTMLYEDDRDALSVAANDFLFTCDRTYHAHLHSFTKNVFFLPPAAQFETAGTPREEYAAPISYVGTIPDVAGNLTALSSIQNELIEQVEHTRSQNHRTRFTELLANLSPAAHDREAIQQQAEAFASTTNKELTNAEAMLEYFLYATSTYHKRKRIVEALLPVGLKVFGPDRWLVVLGSQYADRYGGYVDNNDLADCYASAGISLNLHSHQCPTCLNTRDFDVPAAGGICLSDWVDDMNLGMLEPGREVLTFRETEEAVELARHFSHDASLLLELRDRALQRVQRDHTYRHRAEAVLRILREHGK